MAMGLWKVWAKAVGVVLLAAFLGSTALAGDNGPLVTELKAYKVVRQADGTDKLAEADKAAPGDVIEYHALYKNRSNRVITGIRATVPIPKGTVYVSKSAKPAEALASVDGKSFGAIPLKRQVKMANGQMKAVTVPLSEYRFVRWTIEKLGAQESKTVIARVRVVSTGPPAGSEGGEG